MAFAFGAAISWVLAWTAAAPLGPHGPGEAVASAPTAPPVPAGAASQLLVVTFASDALASDASYRAYLPPGYGAPDSAPSPAPRYPLVVLLHGLGGQGADWFDPTRGDLVPTLDHGIASGALAPLVAIAPDGRNGYWTDHRDGLAGHAYGRYLDEVVADAERRFRLRPAARALVGVSMGGHGAMLRALREPERWRAVVSIAGALFAAPPTHRPIYKEVWGDPPDPAYWAAESPMGLLAAWPAQRALPPIFLSCGAEDTERFLDLTLGAETRLVALGARPPVVITPGAHTWTAWRAATPRWLPWLEAQLVRP